jgi:hypothetical protein
MADDKIEIEIVLDDGSIAKGFANINKAAKETGDSIGNSFDKSLTGFVIQLEFAFKVISKVAGAISGFLGDAVAEASAAELGLQQFNLALANTGQYSKQASEDFLAFANVISSNGTVAVDTLVAGAKDLVAIGNLSGQALEKATQASVDLAAGLGVDAASAFDLVSKAAAGNTGALGRYGIKVDESIPKSERFAAALELINQKFGGFDAAKANTFGGALTNLGNSFNEFLQEIGGVITSSPLVVGTLKFIGDQFLRLRDAIKSLAGGGLFKTIENNVLKFADVMVGPLARSFEVVYNAGKFLISALETGFSVLFTSVVAVIKKVAEAGNFFGVVSDETLAKLQTLQAASVETTTQFAADTATSFTAITDDTTISDGINNFYGSWRSQIDQTVTKQTELKNNTIINNEAIKQSTILTNQQITSGISSAVQATTKALIAGQNGFKAFASSVLAVMGGWAISMGETLVAAGLGIDALKASLVGFGGGQAIAAGIALIALGTILQSLGSGSQAPGVSGGGGGGGAGSAPGGAPVGAEAAPAIEEKSTKVQIDVAGTVLDPISVGNQIADILNNTFSAGGTQVQTGLA